MQMAFWFVFFTWNTLIAGDSLRIMESMAMHSRILGQEVRYSICLPGDYYTSGETYPAVYLLHGLGDDETSWLEYGRISQYADQAVGDGEVVPMILVMPQGFRTYYVNDYLGSFRYQDMFVNEFVPYIDSMFRTIPDGGHRAVMGYSMGGFGALMLPVKHPDMFSVSVPLSISVRTDEQYMTEDSGEWDNQWGSIFGAPGQKGPARITSYYRRNSPFHVLDSIRPESIAGVRIYIDNGDEEQTLCRSNEELHILMHRRDIPHEFRVRNGGHSFEYWCSALPNALRFISDAFESKPYRGDKMPLATEVKLTGKQLQAINISGKEIIAYLPDEYEQTNRYYPVIYFIGDWEPSSREGFALLADQEIRENTVCPLILVFLPLGDTSEMLTLLPVIEKELRVRRGYRMRSVAGFREGAPVALALGMLPEQFGSCLLTDAVMTGQDATALLSGATRDSMRRTWLFIDAPDKGSCSEGNGNAHMILRDRNVQHEYRVREGSGGPEWSEGGFIETLKFAANRFHK